MLALSGDYDRQGISVGLVPTMGALHPGHLSLMERARSENELSVASIFINPVQFGEGEDFAQYPRDMAGDLEKLDKAGIDIVFFPEVPEMYPEGYRTYISVEGADDTMCGTFRPGHFRGVATVVTKLFNIVRPSRAYFGEKDYQQLQVIRALTKDLNMGIEIIGCPIVREKDGLAMSSRNAYLGEQERQAAKVLYSTLQDLAGRIRSENIRSDIAEEFRRILAKEPLIREIQYASAYDPDTLQELKETGKRKRVLLALAVKIGSTRLIDNIMVDL